MSRIAAGIVAEFQFESANTRTMLERVPEDKFDWKPHEKSMTIGRLATHLAELPQWCGTILDQEELDLAGSDYKPVTASSVAELLELFDANAEAFLQSVGERNDDEMLAGWTLRVGDNILGTQPKVSALRAFILSHAVHHRGQLSVFLRLLDVPLPQVYGPTADDLGAFG
ncbi:MAG: DinB family protein [Acidobacteriota bacterium]|nr:DinB family protein [Acidobacteriota bacterium]